MAKKNLNNTELVYALLIKSTIIESAAASCRLAGGNLTDKEVQDLYARLEKEKQIFNRPKDPSTSSGRTGKKKIHRD